MSLLIPYWFQSQNSYIYFESKYFLNWSDNAADVIFTILAKTSVTSQAQCYAIFMVGKSDQNKRNDWKFAYTSNDCQFTYMLDFILKPGAKLEYQGNASLSKFKGNLSINTCWKSRWKFVCEWRIWPAWKSFLQPQALVILCVWAKMASMFINRYLRYWI